MKLQEILKAKGLSDEDVQSVIGEMKQNKIFISYSILIASGIQTVHK